MTKKLLITVFAAMALLAIASLTPTAANAPSTTIGPYEGVFTGTIYGDNGSSAPITLDLTHRGDDVEGTMEIGNGLYVNGRYCGAGYVPAAVQTAVGETGSNPNRLTADAGLNVSGMKIGISIDGNLSADGEEVSVEATIDLPWLCGRDPIVTGELIRR